MTKLLIGTNNEAKVAEYRKLLKGMGFELVSAKELGIEAPEENEPTFEDQAAAKAKYYYKKSGLPTIVDDGGFEIAGLNGEPGIKSNRWIGRKMTDEEIIAEVMKRTKDLKSNERDCRHVILLAVATPFGVFTAHGHIDGVVAEKPSEKREPGFPYRSVMYLPNYKKYWIDLTKEEDQILNHRRAAIEKVKDILKELKK